VAAISKSLSHRSRINADRKPLVENFQLVSRSPIGGISAPSVHPPLSGCRSRLQRIQPQAVAGIGHPLLQAGRALSISPGLPLEEDSTHSASVTASRDSRCRPPGSIRRRQEQASGVLGLLRQAAARNASNLGRPGGIWLCAAPDPSADQPFHGGGRALIAPRPAERSLTSAQCTSSRPTGSRLRSAAESLPPRRLRGREDRRKP